MSPLATACQHAHWPPPDPTAAPACCARVSVRAQADAPPVEPVHLAAEAANDLLQQGAGQVGAH